jgi:hypothetical protein
MYTIPRNRLFPAPGRSRIRVRPLGCLAARWPRTPRSSRWRGRGGSDFGVPGRGRACSRRGPAGMDRAGPMRHSPGDVVRAGRRRRKPVVPQSGRLRAGRPLRPAHPRGARPRGGRRQRFTGCGSRPVRRWRQAGQMPGRYRGGPASNLSGRLVSRVVPHGPGVGRPLLRGKRAWDLVGRRAGIGHVGPGAGPRAATVRSSVRGRCVDVRWPGSR